MAIIHFGGSFTSNSDMVKAAKENFFLNNFSQFKFCDLLNDVILLEYPKEIVFLKKKSLYLSIYLQKDYRWYLQRQIKLGDTCHLNQNAKQRVPVVNSRSKGSPVSVADNNLIFAPTVKMLTSYSWAACQSNSRSLWKRFKNRCHGISDKEHRMLSVLLPSIITHGASKMQQWGLYDSFIMKWPQLTLPTRSNCLFFTAASSGISWEEQKSFYHRTFEQASAILSESTSIGSSITGHTLHEDLFRRHYQRMVQRTAGPCRYRISNIFIIYCFRL